MVWAVPLTTTELIPRCLTPIFPPQVFVVWFGLVSLRPLADPEPYPLWLHNEAAPQCISGRTSYLRVRLAFHLYPQLISEFCNIREFGPP